jgi:hypothetical protein
MTSLSDTLTVGLVLVLLFGSIALYLYTRIQQAEQKISLLESILLDLKMSSEIKSYLEPPASNEDVNKLESTDYLATEYIPFSETSNDDEETPGCTVDCTDLNLNLNSNKSESSLNNKHELENNEVAQYKSVIADAVKEDNDVKDEKTSNNYEAMTLKELQTLAKTRGISGAGSMKKGAIVEALKTSDRSQNTIEPGLVGSSSFLETSSSFQPASEESN